MPLALNIFLMALKAIPAAVAAIPDVKATLDASISMIHPKDQETAKTAYQNLIADNDAGYRELDRLLEQASKA